MTLQTRDLTRLDLFASDDLVLVELAKTGCHQAFQVLVERHGERAHALALGMMRNDADARDCVQDALLNAWRKIETFRGDAAFSSWLYRITHNACLMKMRSRRRRPEVPLELQGSGDDESFERQLPDPRPLADHAFEVDELGQHIDAAVATLPVGYRTVFELADLEHLSMKDIADQLELTVPNVKTRLHRARLRLRGELTAYLAA
jgi:RNA polymerase sigma-70 factor (ECF subfamily)